MTKATKVLGYIRVSTAHQAETGLGLDDQRSRIEAYCMAVELELSEIYMDAGASAKTLHGRPELDKALASLKMGEASGLVVLKLDRLVRSVVDMGSLIEEHFSNGVRLISVSESIDTSTAAGRLVVNMLASVAQWEREAISERVSAALAQKTARGEWVGRPPVGSEVVKKGQNPTKKPDNDPESIAIARLVMLRRRGLPMARIASLLNEDGLRTKNGMWHPTSVRRALVRLGKA